MRSILFAAVSAIALAALPQPALADHHRDAVVAAKAAPLSDLLSQVEIPYDQFTLPNGLRVVVHEDRSAPLVAVSVWYNVGSKHEPKGKTGFAHLFEHVLFAASENVPEDFFKPLQDAGATDLNGSTWFDRTNYYETVPTGALELALMLESDRMGHLLGAVTQAAIDNEIDIVKNEKRMGDNAPFGLVGYEQLETLFPPGHPYHHDTIGSMPDLDSATLDDVHQWFKDHYGPNNAVLALAGDIDLPTAQQLVTKWFAHIEPGPPVRPVVAPVPTLPEKVSKTIYDNVATTRIYRNWAVPGSEDPDHIALQIAMDILGGIDESRLERALEDDAQVAVDTSAGSYTFTQAGLIQIYADVKPGEDADTAARLLDAEIARLIAEGPSAEELQRASTLYVAGAIRGLDKIGSGSGKAAMLARGALYDNDPGILEKRLRSAAALTPEAVRAVLQKWLTRPTFELVVAPGERREGGENRGQFGDVDDPRADWPVPPVPENLTAVGESPDRSSYPEVADLKPLDFPAIERATLSNGMAVHFAHHDTVPTVSVQVSFDAGFAADPKSALGTQSLLLQLMDEGTTSLDADEFTVTKQKLGAAISAGSGWDRTAFTLSALAPNLAPSLALLADYIRNPALDGDDLERVRAQQLSRIDAELTNPSTLAQRVSYPLLYGENHPYAVPPSGLGERAAVTGLVVDDLQQFHANWLRPDNANVYVVGDTTLDEAVALLEASFGDWQAPATPKPVKDFSVPIPEQSRRIVFVDRPGAPQSMLRLARVVSGSAAGDRVDLDAANFALGGSITSRLSANIRETQGWTYSIGSGVTAPRENGVFLVVSPVQTDKTGEAIAEILREIDEYSDPGSGRGITAEELARLKLSRVRSQPGAFETAGDLLGGLAAIVEMDRPDDYYEQQPARYEALTAADVDAAAQAELRDDDLLIVVVGDREAVMPQLETLAIPVEEIAVEG